MATPSFTDDTCWWVHLFSIPKIELFEIQILQNITSKPKTQTWIKLCKYLFCSPLNSYTCKIGIEFSTLDEPTISIDQKKESETHT